MAIVLVTVQGFLLYLHGKDKTETRYAGVLNLLLAILAFTAFFLFSTGALILSPEYGVLLAQGTSAWVWSWAVILGISIGMGLVLHAVRQAHNQAHKRKNRVTWLVTAGAIIGIVTAARIQELNPLSSPPFRVRCSDLWTYPFIAWLVVCITEWIFATLQVDAKPKRTCGTVLLLTSFALLVVYRAQLQFVYADPYALKLWKMTAWLGVPVVMSLLTWIVLNRFWSREKFGLTIAKSVASLLAGAVGLWTAYLWILMPTRWILTIWKWNATPRTIALVVWAAWLVALFLHSALWYYRSLRQGKALPFLHIGGSSRVDDFVAVVAAVALVGSIVDMSHSTRLDPVWDLTFLISSWAVLVEIVGGYPIRTYVIPWIAKKLLIVRTLLERALSHLGGLVGLVLSPFRQLFKGGSDSVTGFVKIVIVVMLIVALSEIPNTGKIIILPFSTVGLSDKDKDLGEVVSNRIVNTIGLVGQELRPDLLVVAKDGTAKWVPASSEQGSGLKAAATNNNLQIPGTTISIPLGLLATPVQKPMRWLLGVRVITGSVQREGDRYVLLASSSDGLTWRTESEAVVNPEATQGAAPLINLAITVNTGDNSVKHEGASESNPQGGKNGSSIQSLADQLAYRIVTSDAAFSKLGMTSSWTALQAFRDGLKYRTEFERNNDYDFLTASINSFRAATREDPKFAMAYYRLGLDLLDDGQPPAAVDAFRNSLSAAPKFVTGHILLAQTLSDFETKYYPLPAALAGSQKFPPEESRSRRIEARRLLQRVILDLRAESSFSDRAAAYAGLCRNAFGLGLAADQGPKLSWQYVAFFYCKRAEYLYSKLSPALRADARAKDGEVWVLYALGTILDQNTDFEGSANSDKSPSPQQEQWRCRIDSYRLLKDGKMEALTPELSIYVQAARKYYRQALKLLPEDPYILCSYATMSLTIDKREMQRLYSNDKAHFALAEAFSDKADELSHPDEGKPNFASAAAFYRRALEEYRRAIKLAPTNVDALNNFAYISWRWRLMAVGQDRSAGPSASILHRAEEYARRATQLTELGSSRTLHATTQSTLGEVLLAQSRPNEAIEVLEEVFHPKGGPQPAATSHALFDEMRWDLAEAYICATHNDSGARPELPAKAVPLFDQIRNNEVSREKRFLNMPNLLDPVRSQIVCWSTPETAVENTPSAKGPLYKLEQPAYSSHAPCNWLGVVGDAFEKPGTQVKTVKDQLYLHVWGGGVDRRISAGEPREDVVLSSNPKNTRYYYFAQLEKEKEGGDGVDPVSQVYPIQTFANANPTQCQKNLIWLTFKKVRD